MRLYIAGSRAEIDRAERAMAAARNAGFVVTCDWTVDIRLARDAGHVSDATLPAHEQARSGRPVCRRVVRGRQRALAREAAGDVWRGTGPDLGSRRGPGRVGAGR